MKSCVVTGASGLIGSHFLKTIGKDWSIFAVTRYSQRETMSNDKIKYINLDLAHQWNFDSLPKEVDAVVHLAQSEHFRDFPDHAENIFQVNTSTTLRLLDYARKVGAKAFILASSGGIYGYGDREFSEDVEIFPKGDLGFYLGTKLCSEVIAESYAPFLNIVILRFFFVYGCNQRETMLIPRLVRSVLDGKPITLQGKEGIKINPTYVSDAAMAVTNALNLKGSHKINIGGAQILSLKEIGEIIGEEVDKEPVFEVQANANPKNLVGNIHKMSRLLGMPRTSFSEGIKMYVDQTYF